MHRRSVSSSIASSGYGDNYEESAAQYCATTKRRSTMAASEAPNKLPNRRLASTRADDGGARAASPNDHLICESKLYDAFELQELEQQLERHLTISEVEDKCYNGTTHKEHVQNKDQLQYSRPAVRSYSMPRTTGSQYNLPPHGEQVRYKQVHGGSHGHTHGEHVPNYPPIEERHAHGVHVQAEAFKSPQTVSAPLMRARPQKLKATCGTSRWSGHVEALFESLTSTEKDQQQEYGDGHAQPKEELDMILWSPNYYEPHPHQSSDMAATGASSQEHHPLWPLAASNKVSKPFDEALEEPYSLQSLLQSNDYSYQGGTIHDGHKTHNVEKKGKHGAVSKPPRHQQNLSLIRAQNRDKESKMAPASTTSQKHSIHRHHIHYYHVYHHHHHHHHHHHQHKMQNVHFEEIDWPFSPARIEEIGWPLSKSDQLMPSTTIQPSHKDYT